MESCYKFGSYIRVAVDGWYISKASSEDINQGIYGPYLCKDGKWRPTIPPSIHKEREGYWKDKDDAIAFLDSIEEYIISYDF